jgi:hypothetical protein
MLKNQHAGACVQDGVVRLAMTLATVSVLPIVVCSHAARCMAWMG